MGDCDWLRKPDIACKEENGVDAMLRIIREGNGDIEILALGPLTNLAAAMLLEPHTMAKVPRITIIDLSRELYNGVGSMDLPDAAAFPASAAPIS